MNILAITSALLFAIGLFAVLARRNAVLVLVGIELMLNAANLNVIATWRSWGGMSPLVFVLVSIVLAAAEAAVGLAIILMVFRLTRSADVNRLDDLHG